MNIYQMVFVILVLMPPILSILIDELTDRINGLRWLAWHESLLMMYLVEGLIVGLLLVFALLGTI